LCFTLLVVIELQLKGLAQAQLGAIAAQVHIVAIIAALNNFLHQEIFSDHLEDSSFLLKKLNFSLILDIFFV